MLSIPEEYETVDCTQLQKVEPSQHLRLPNRLHRAGSILDNPAFLRFSRNSQPIKPPAFQSVPVPKAIPPFPLGAAHAALVEGIDEGIWRAVKKARKEEREEEKRLIKRRKREEGQREVLRRVSSGLEVVCIYDDKDEEGEGEIQTHVEASDQTGTIDDKQSASPMTLSIKELFPPPLAGPLSAAPRPLDSCAQNAFDDLPATQPDILDPLEDIPIPIDTDQPSSKVLRPTSGQDIHTSFEVTNNTTPVEAGYPTSYVLLSGPATIEMTIAEEGSQVLDVQTLCSSDIIHPSSSAISPEMDTIRETQESPDTADDNTANEIARVEKSISQDATSTDDGHVEPSATSLFSQLSALTTACEVPQILPSVSDQDETEKRNTGSSSSFYVPCVTPASIRVSTDPNGRLTETPIRLSDEEDICPSSQLEDDYWDSPLANLGRGVPKPSRNHVTNPIPYTIFQAPISPSYKTGASPRADGESTKAKFDMRKTGYLPTPSPSPSPTKLPRPNFRGHVIPGHSALGVGKFF